MAHRAVELNFQGIGVRPLELEGQQATGHCTVAGEPETTAVGKVTGEANTKAATINRKKHGDQAITARIVYRSL